MVKYINLHLNAGAGFNSSVQPTQYLHHSNYERQYLEIIPEPFTEATETRNWFAFQITVIH